MRHRRFAQVDVFTTRATKGNGLAVLFDVDDLTMEEMQDFAAWTNLAETAFLRQPKDPRADYVLRIFTPAREMPFAGHPTLGSCAAWRHAGGIPQRAGCVVQECAIGLVEIRLDRGAPAFVAPPTRIAPMPENEIASLCSALRIGRDSVLRAAHLDNGPTWQVLELADAEAALAIDASLVSWPTYRGVAVLGAYPEGSPCDYEVRSLSPSSGMSEDPITGSLNAAIAIWMAKEARLTSALTVGQGTRMGRLGRVFITPASETMGGEVLIGGESRIVITGTACL